MTLAPAGTMQPEKVYMISSPVPVQYTTRCYGAETRRKNEIGKKEKRGKTEKGEKNPYMKTPLQTIITEGKERQEQSPIRAQILPKD